MKNRNKLRIGRVYWSTWSSSYQMDALRDGKPDGAAATFG
jgi:hypothetical protein